MKFNDLIKAYAARLKIDDTCNEDGSIDITYGGEISVNFHLKSNGRVIAAALLDTAGKETAEYDLQYLMRLHLSRIKTDDSILSINPDNQELELYDVIDISDINVKQFEDRVGLFLSSIRFWRAYLVADTEKFDNQARF